MFYSRTFAISGYVAFSNPTVEWLNLTLMTYLFHLGNTMPVTFAAYHFFLYSQLKTKLQKFVETNHSKFQTYTISHILVNTKQNKHSLMHGRYQRWMLNEVLKIWYLSIKFSSPLRTKDNHNTKSMQNKFLKTKCFRSTYHNILKMVRFSFYNHFFSIFTIFNPLWHLPYLPDCI